MTVSKTQAILVGIALLAVAIVFFVAGRGCAPSGPAPIHPGGIDAGPGEAEIAARLDGSIQAGRVHLAQIEEKFEDDVAAFDTRQREEYERLANADLDEAARFLSEWSRRRRDGGR